MATVIFSNMGDTDTAVLKYIWMGMPKVKVVEITKSTVNAKALVNEAIEQEHDTLIMCGHGTPQGLLNPSFKGGTYLIDRTNKDLIRCNRIIAVWCHAKDFAETYGVKGFWSSMFISNSGEASMNGIKTVSDQSITEQEILFCIRLNELIRNYEPMKTWVDTLREQADYTNPVVKFNYDGLRYYKVAPTPKPVYYGGYYGSYNWDDDDFADVMDAESARWGVDVRKVEDTDTKGPNLVPYEPKGVGGIRKTSLKDATVVKTVKPKRQAVKKAKQYAINDAVIDDFTGISLDEEYPPEVWGFQD